MFASARFDAAAFEELERLVRSLGEELAFFRRRALEAERRLRDATPPAGTPGVNGAAAPSAEVLSARVRELEQENAQLRERLAEATERTRAMVDRVRFLRQQQDGEP